MREIDPCRDITSARLNRARTSAVFANATFSGFLGFYNFTTYRRSDKPPDECREARTSERKLIADSSTTGKMARALFPKENDPGYGIAIFIERVNPYVADAPRSYRCLRTLFAQGTRARVESDRRTVKMISQRYAPHIKARRYDVVKKKDDEKKIASTAEVLCVNGFSAGLVPRCLCSFGRYGTPRGVA
jgi:hypothetical protein